MMWQSDVSLVLAAVLGLAATVVAILRDTARRLKGSGDLPAPALPALDGG